MGLHLLITISRLAFSDSGRASSIVNHLIQLPLVVGWLFDQLRLFVNVGWTAECLGGEDLPIAYPDDLVDFATSPPPSSQSPVSTQALCDVTAA